MLNSKNILSCWNIHGHWINDLGRWKRGLEGEVNIDIKCSGCIKTKKYSSHRCTSNKTEAKNKPFHFKAVHFSNHKAWAPSARERIWRLMHSCPLFTAQTTLSKTTLHLNSLGFGGPAIWKTRVSFRAETRSIVCIGGGDWATETYAFLGLIVNSQLPRSPLPPYEGRKKTFLMLLSYFYFLIFDLTVGLHSTIPLMFMHKLFLCW